MTLWCFCFWGCHPPSVLGRRPARGRPLPDPRGLGWEGFRPHKCACFAEHHRGAVEASSPPAGRRPSGSCVSPMSRLNAAGLRKTTHVAETSTVTTTSVQRVNPASAVQNSLAAYSIAVAK